MEDYAILLQEEEFLKNPTETLNNVTKFSDYYLSKVLAGVRIVQQMILPDHPKSLFVPAFCHETMTSIKQSYYSMQLPVV